MVRPVPRLPSWLALLCLVLLALVTAGFRPAHSDEDRVITPTNGPKGVLLNARPTLIWYIWMQSGSPMVDVQMMVNGELVRVGYAPQIRAVYFTPAQPLPPGPYEVECQVLFGNGVASRSRWSFQISADAVSELPVPDDTQNRALRAVNQIRRQLRLPECRLDARLCAAAFAHCSYLRQNRIASHDEVPGRPGFFARNLLERIQTLGYVSPEVLEDVSVNETEGSHPPPSLVQELFDAPYHRLPFLRPDAVDLGVGYDEAGYLTLDWGTMRAPRSQAPILSLYPLPSQRDVPLTFNGFEDPDPLRMHGVKAPVGYVITYLVSGADEVGVRFSGARLTTSTGEDVPVYINTPANDDHLHDEVFVIPREPLRPHTRYIVNVQAYAPNGANLSRTWDFMTRGEAAPQSGETAKDK